MIKTLISQPTTGSQERIALMFKELESDKRTIVMVSAVAEMVRQQNVFKIGNLDDDKAKECLSMILLAE